MTSAIFRTALILAMLAAVAGPLHAAERHYGTFSHGAVDMWSSVAGTNRTATFTSPDKTWTVALSGADTDAVNVRVRGRLGRLDIATADFVDAELVWAPDSSGAFFTGSEGGAVGQFNLHVIRRRNGRLTETDLSPLVRKAFGHPVRCFSPEDPNVGGIRWLGPRRVLVAAEIPPHSNCDNMGTFRAYIVDLDRMKVVRSYDQLTTKRLFGSSIGQELKGADDSCIRQPASCWVPQLHQRKSRPSS
ncbi:hypothetical protein [Asticcacaulis solisilvae]|uniref:hypothetical protein n=1 Tax=Asticcacaulis solisilvae TaxID=1217274 RepID=UPI003FD81D42